MQNIEDPTSMADLFENIATSYIRKDFLTEDKKRYNQYPNNGAIFRLFSAGM